MTIGTKSVLYGAHAFWLHPWFVAIAWWKLYGFPVDRRLWAAFFVHDLGYWGKPNMDGFEGESHPSWGAAKMNKWFGLEWSNLCLYHSRYYAKTFKRQPSKLCYADKMAFVTTPKWIYLTMVWLTGEWKEYDKAHEHECGHTEGMVAWYTKSAAYTLAWVKEHFDGREDTWTKAKKTT